MLSKEASITIFWVFGMTQPGILCVCVANLKFWKPRLKQFPSTGSYWIWTYYLTSSQIWISNCLKCKFYFESIAKLANKFESDWAYFIIRKWVVFFLKIKSRFNSHFNLVFGNFKGFCYNLSRFNWFTLKLSQQIAVVQLW